MPGEVHGQKSLADYSLWGRKESDMTEQLTHIIITMLKIFCNTVHIKSTAIKKSCHCMLTFVLLIGGNMKMLVFQLIF